MSAGIDKELVGRRFRRALPTYARNADIQRRMAARLLEMIEFAGGVPRHIGRVFEFGSGSAILTSMLFDRYSVETFFSNDLVAESCTFVEKAVAGRPVGRMEFMHGDVESLEVLPDNLDLVISNATLQWLHEPDSFFGRLAGSVRPGGLVAFSTFGVENMREIAALEEAALPYRSLDEIVALAGELFEVSVIQHEIIRQEFENPEAVLRHIRETGVNGVARRTWTRSQYLDFLRRYRAAYHSGSGVILTWHPVYCCFRRKKL
jgi:malonyl-CoA O-methyltransferase